MKLVSESIAAIKSFVKKLELYIGHMQNFDLTHFQQLKTSIAEEPNPPADLTPYTTFLAHLLQNFNHRFGQFNEPSFAALMKFASKPLEFDVSECKQLAEVVPDFDRKTFESELLDLQSADLSAVNWTKISQRYLQLISARVLAIFSVHISLRTYVFIHGSPQV